MTTAKYSIGKLGEATGCKVQTVRYYEEIGLMPPPGRTAGNQRRYTERHVERLGFIRHSRQLGFSLEAIRQLLSLADDPAKPCEQVDRMARLQLRDVESKIARLQSLESELRRMLDQCKGGCVEDCRVIGVLSDHSQCLHDHHLVPEDA